MLRALANDKLSITGVAIFGHASALLSYRDTKLRCAVASTTTRQNEIIQFMHCRSTMPLFSYSRTRMKRAVVNAAAKRVAQPDAPHILSAEYVFWITSFYATAFAMVHITAHSPRSLPTRRGQDITQVAATNGPGRARQEDRQISASLFSKWIPNLLSLRRAQETKNHNRVSDQARIAAFASRENV
jgi:hypothetical protein